MRLRNATTTMNEQQIQQRILLACGNGPQRLWRNNVGTGWAGPSTRVTPGNVRAVAAALQPGDVVIRGGRPLHAGLCQGSSDLIGYTGVTIGHQHLGQQLAVFTAVEVKSERGRATAEQVQFLKHIQSAGGRSGIARSVADAQAIMETP